MALTIGASLRLVWRGLAILLLLSASFSSKAHEIRPALLEMTQLTKTQWRLRFRQPQMMGRVLPLVPHGLFSNDTYRAQWLSEVRGGPVAETAYAREVEHDLDTLAEEMARHCDLGALFAQAQTVGWQPQ